MDLCFELMCQLYIIWFFFGEAIPLSILLATCVCVYVYMCVCVCVFHCGHQMNHFLNQDSLVFSSCELEAKPDVYLPAGFTASVKGHLSFLLFPYSPFLPLLSLGKDWDCHVNRGHRLLPADTHQRPRLLLVPSSQVSRPGSPFCFLGSPSHCWEICRLLWVEQGAMMESFCMTP